MYCTNCGAQINPNESFCLNCGMAQNSSQGAQPEFAQNQGYNVPPQGGFSPNYNENANRPPVGGGFQANGYGWQYGNNFQQQPPEPDVPSAGYNALSFFIPLIGLILFITWNDKTPNKAKSCGKWALAGYITSFVFGILLYAVSMFFQFSYMF